MLKRILLAGLAAGLITGGFLFISISGAGDNVFEGDHGNAAIYGYASMLLALSLIFVAVKRQRDVAQGGVIKFLPAFGMGLAISLVASIIYALGWELTLATTGLDFIGPYTEAAIQSARESGMSGDELAAFIENKRGFADMYNDPVYRFPITMLELLPVGVLVSLVSAALLRNSNFLAHRPTG
ncbi:DUF4199 domain-containing protein [Henriciella litoralis]|uniref:DUF4199 domain-containing protein n=1 Tax=Henriciella litoralis TaxID=568102 RepID=UPI000A039FDE|nr:DUF4199 domain-containing protein [Henriciella litoralis]